MAAGVHRAAFCNTFVQIRKRCPLWPLIGKHTFFRAGAAPRVHRRADAGDFVQCTTAQLYTVALRTPLIITTLSLFFILFFLAG